jgi:hypothetical protein
MQNLVETVVILLSTLVVCWAGFHAAYSVKSGPVELILMIIAMAALLWVLSWVASKLRGKVS